MRYQALACDYDGTLACNGVVDDKTIEAVRRLRDSGRKALLVTGRELEELLSLFPHTGLFERVIAENGALVYSPGSKESRLLAEPPPQKFLDFLRARNVHPLHRGRVIIATHEPQETVVLEVIRELGLELQVIFNKGSVMILPTGVNKASGLKAALKELNISRSEVVGVGDAENDHALLDFCGFSVAVANAIPALKERACWVTGSTNGFGVVELIDRLVGDDLPEAKSIAENASISKR